ncbi:branched-chain amino acid aminotransferase [Litorimonas taeanensis]|uniref:Probable branched-chain-amino-acid aminotransferase n=1 Tax=Litorimonas taeanensis TaxID=568099 RepID=A0A420WDC8_9PROT|nr:aminotransferase class IV [Litorimonas taeanensis]RKQ69044.1 branched-chain amino acid aminotransferase [Litorimonas taeanensis]
MSYGSHAYVPDARNESVLFNVNGKMLPREKAVVNVFDSGFMLGDGVWEGLRVHNGKVAFLQDHLDRLWEGAAALDIDIGLSQAELSARIEATLAINNMHEDVHIRLMLTRGLRSTPYQDPRVIISDATIVIAPEYKKADPETARRPLSLYTVSVRRGRADVQDPGLNSHSKINCITACIQAIKAGADEGLMLDPQGFVATCNSTHFFVVRKGEVWTSSGDYCLGGITRGKIIDLCRANDIPVFQKNFSLMKCYSADEAFTTGTFAGLAPVGEIDGRKIGSGKRGPMVERLQKLYMEHIHKDTVG